MVIRAGPAPIALVLALAGLAAACGGGGESSDEASITAVAPENGRIEVVASEWGFTPNGLLLTVGEDVTIQLENDGRILHDFKIAAIPADVVRSESSGPLEADEGDVFVGADSGASGTLEIVPLEAGSYDFYCTIAGHRELGMEGTVVVQAAP